jgi:parvulin-like peptidyl-prolyl isomerase
MSRLTLSQLPVQRLYLLALVAALSFSTLSLTACGPEEQGLAGSTKGGETVAVVNGETITQNEYDKIRGFYAKLMKVDTAANMGDNPVVDEVLKQMSVQQLVMLSLLEQEADKLGVAVSNDDLLQAINKQQKLVGGAGPLNKLLADQGMSIEDFKDSLKQQLLVNKLTDELSGGKVAVTDDEAKAYYNENAAQFQVPLTIRSSHILVKAIEPELRNELQKASPKLTAKELDAKVEQAMAAKRQQADALLAKIKADPTQFEALAKAQNDDEMAAKKAGDIGFMSKNMSDPGYWQALVATPPGTLRPELVKSSFGYHIVQVHEKKEAHQVSFDEAKPTISEQLAQQKRAKFITNWLEERKEASAIEIKPNYQPMKPQAPEKAGATGQPEAQAPAPKAAPAAPKAG